MKNNKNINNKKLLNDNKDKLILKKKPASKCRKWFFTIWKMDIDWEETYAEFNDIIRFMIGQKEKAPKTGRLHWQGCIHMYNPCRMGKIRKLLSLGSGENSGDLSPQQGTNKQVRDYVHKMKSSMGEQFTFGKPSQQGIRNDFEDIKKRIEEGESQYSISQDHFGTYSRCSRWAKEYQGLHLQAQSKDYRLIDIEILSGPTGCGKTRKAYDNYDINSIFKINCADGLKWFDGYEGQSVLVLDEFKNQAQLTRILDLLDGHQCRLEYKGGMTYAMWTKIYITTNLKKDEIYPNIKSHLVAPFWRRITKFINLYARNEVTSGNTGSSVLGKRKKVFSGLPLSLLKKIKLKQSLIKFSSSESESESDSSID